MNSSYFIFDKSDGRILKDFKSKEQAEQMLEKCCKHWPDAYLMFYFLL